MQRATADPAPCCPGGGRKVAVEDEQLLIELGGGQDGMPRLVIRFRTLQPIFDSIR
jgi:hypothetical protein